MSYPLLKRDLKQMLKPFLIFFAILTMYYGVIIYMYDPELMDMLNEYQELMPELMSAVGMTGATDTLLKFINTYLYGFLMMLFPLIYLVLLGNHYLMDYEDSGSLACILATPNSRRKIIFTQAISLFTATFFLMIAVTGMGILFAESMFPGELEIKKYLLLNVAAFLLQWSISGIIFLAACIFQDRKSYYLLGCGLPLLFYLLSMLGNMGDTFSWMKKLSLYTLFPSEQIVNGSGSYGGCFTAMVVIAVGCYGAGSWYFCRKDLFL